MADVSYPNLDKVIKEYFTWENKPVLKRGYVSKELQATDEQLKSADRLLKERVQQYGWRKGDLSEEELACCQKTYAESFKQDGDVKDDDAEEYPEVQSNLVRTCIWKPLPFYPEGKLVHLLIDGDTDFDDAEPSEAVRFILARPDEDTLRGYRMNGTSPPIHKASHECTIDFAAKGSREEYISFFCEHVYGDNGPFTVPEEKAISDSRPCPKFYYIADNRLREEDPAEQVNRPLAELPCAITRISGNEEGVEPNKSEDKGKSDVATESEHVFIATVKYSGTPFRAAIKVLDDGMIEMVDDCPLHDEIAATMQVRPRWDPTREKQS